MVYAKSGLKVPGKVTIQKSISQAELDAYLESKKKREDYLNRRGGRSWLGLERCHLDIDEVPYGRPSVPLSYIKVNYGDIYNTYNLGFAYDQYTNSPTYEFDTEYTVQVVPGELYLTFIPVDKSVEGDVCIKLKEEDILRFVQYQHPDNIQPFYIYLSFNNNGSFYTISM